MNWTPTPHPWFRLPSQEEAIAVREREGDQGVIRMLEERETKIERAKKNPFTHGVRLPHWIDADGLLETYDRLLISGGNRSGKTQYAARIIAEKMATIPEYEVAVFGMTNQSSIRDQQSAIYNWMPNEWKELKGRSKVTALTYSIKNGFADNVAVGPNRSRCSFYSYAHAPDILEGASLDLLWFDELVPYSWIETGAYRLITKRGKMLITATPITGWTPVVSDFLNNMEVIDDRPAALLRQDKVHVRGCRPGHMPYRARCLRKDSAVIFFRTEDNPFSPKEEMERTLAAESEATKRCRAYGYVERSQAGFFPKFSNTHIIPHDQIPTQNVTRYMCVDPAGSRMWSAIWLAVDQDGLCYVYREFPDFERYGEWALPGEKAEGQIGEAAKPQGWGLSDYRNEFLRLEAGEEISERLIDPRAGGTSHQTQDGSETLIDLLGDGDSPLYFIPASGIHVDQGYDRINNMLTYNVEEPISIVNRPQLYISDRCKNLISCMQNLTAAGGDKNKFKDMVDTLRYLAVHGPTHYGTDRHATGGGTY